jgi:hypothetical protein
MKKILIKLKYYFAKGALSWGVICLFIAVFFVWFWKPASLYKQHTGTIEKIVESQSSALIGRTNRITVDVYIFHIDGEQYYITKVKNKDYNYLIGEKILFRYTESLDKSKDLIEIVSDGKTIMSIDEYNGRFIKWIIVFILCLSWVTWGVILRWQNVPPEKKKSSKDEESFFENWGIRKKNDKCILTYISKLDGTVKHIKISLDDYLAAKNGKMNLNDFSVKYNLW